MPFEDGPKHWHAAAVASMAEGVVFQDPNGHILRCNEAAERILGLNRDQMNGTTSMGPHWRTIHEDGSPFPGDMHPAMVTLRTGIDQSNIMMGVHKPDGSLTWISINSRAVAASHSEQPSGVVTTFSDVTEIRRTQNLLRMSEEQLAKGFLRSPTIHTISRIEADGAVRLIRVNEAFERQIGFRAQDAVGHTVQELGLWADSNAQEAAIRDFRATGEIRNLAMRFNTKNGNTKDGLLSATTVELAGRMLVLTSLTEVTDQKRQADALEQAAFVSRLLSAITGSCSTQFRMRCL